MKIAVAVLMLVVALFGAMPAAGGEYRYLKQKEFREWIESGKRMIIVDIQEPEEFLKQHFRGSLATGAFPAKSEEDRRKLEGAVKKAAASTVDVVIICPRGGGGAKNSYDYLKERGIDEKRLHILEKGMQGWPYPDVTVRR